MTTMTYDSLVSDVENYADRHDATFISQIPRLIALAEERLVGVHCLGYRRSVTFQINAGMYVVPKPDNWRETTSLNIGVGTGNNRRKFLLYRSYEYARTFWPNSTLTGEPRYYADYDFEHLLIVPTANVEFPAELVFHEKPIPLSGTNQTNWTTKYAPQLLLYAALVESQPFLHRSERIAEFQHFYDKAAMGMINGEKRGLVDDGSMRKDKT